ncbi:hypothetical protein [Halomonas koreensis]|uniref:Panthothenate synthetase n=1 Tax=Halomonas koreensis TaxID=245385 RepID=A0ABU1FYN4_9GAMM|nr:hypothetical protein [Halomonas koreensis]MDR5865332.1 hypothetical protein [Halomonas koreensis]
MRVLINVRIPHEPFNAMVRDGTAGAAIQSILDELQPEAAYFYDPDGHRGGVFVVDIEDSAQLPSLAEPFFLAFEAECDVHIAMAPEDLARAGLDRLGQRWG